MATIEKTIKGLECCGKGNMCSSDCPYDGPENSIEGCTSQLARDALSLIKAIKEQEPSIMTPEKADVLQGFLFDIPSSESILNSVNCHAISLEDASRIIAICACACDVMSPSGFIHWLKERFNQDFILKGCVSG